MRRGFGNDGYGFGRGRRANNPTRIIGGGAATQGVGGHTYGPELWPQPNFAASTGLTLVDVVVNGGVAAWLGGGNAGSKCVATTPPTFVAGEIYKYSITYDNGDGAPLKLSIGGAILNLPTALGTTTLSGTLTVPGTPVQEMGVKNAVDDTGSEDVTLLSIMKQLS